MTRAIEIEGLVRTYRSGLLRRASEVLRGVDLTLERGSTLGLVGPNGSGKTTLMRILAGMDAATSGRVRVLGASPFDAPVRRRVGFLPEDSPFPRELNGKEALHLLGSLHGIDRGERRRRTAELLELVGLAPHARTTLGRYSRGMLRRFGLAQAWFLEPELILLDEPTAGLDAQGFDVLATLMQRARDRSTAVVIASHLASDLTQHTAEVALILDGRIARRGTPQELLAGGGLAELYRSAGGHAR